MLMPFTGAEAGDGRTPAALGNVEVDAGLVVEEDVGTPLDPCVSCVGCRCGPGPLTAAMISPTTSAAPIPPLNSRRFDHHGVRLEGGVRSVVS